MKLYSLMILFFLLLAIPGFKSHTIHEQSIAKADSGEQRAAINYINYCAGCHGLNLEKFAAKNWMQEEDNASAFISIKNGIEDIGMPAFVKTFTDEEIHALAQYVKEGIPDKNMLKPAVPLNGIILSEVQRFTVDTVVTGLNVPWGLAFLPNGDLLISERAGTLHTFSGGKLSAPIKGLPEVMAFGQGGLLDLCLHPDYEKNGWIYISYSKPAEQKGKKTGNTAIMRARLKEGQLVDQQVIFTASPPNDRGHHFGCKLVFDKNNNLYFGVGDRGQHFEFPQKLDNHNGKIHRIRDDGSIPEDNPFVNVNGAMPSIYSFGHRNPQGTVIHPVTGELWITEHGPKGGE